MTTATVASPANDEALSRVLAHYTIVDGSASLIEARIIGRNGSDGSSLAAIVRATVARHNGSVDITDERVSYQTATCPTPAFIITQAGVALSMPRADGEVTWRAEIDGLSTS